MKHALLIAIGCGLVAPAMATAHVAHVDFESGWQNWNGTGTQHVPTGGNPGGHLHTQFTNFGTTYWTDSHQDFLGDYREFDSVTLSIDVKVNEINFFGSPVSRNLILDLRSLTHGQGGYNYSSVWYNLGTIEGGMDWTTFSITFDPNAADMPAGWGGTGDEDPDTFEPKLPDNLSWGDIMGSVEEVAFTTLEPGWVYSINTYFDLQIDNIRIEASTLPAPGAAVVMLGLLAGRSRRREN